MESIGHEALIAVRNGFFNELSNYQSVIIKPSVLADVQVCKYSNKQFQNCIHIVWFFLETTMFNWRIVNGGSTWYKYC